MNKKWVGKLAVPVAVGAGVMSAMAADNQRPNILVIMSDDVGYANVGAYTHGMMVPTPNIDRIAQRGMLFTDHYGQPSCTPGRAAFITGQMPIRTGLTTVGFPGAEIGLSEKDPTLAEVLKPLGYRCGQFGKNHVGDRNEFLPTVHGFDEFFGNLYHLNAEEDPEQEDFKNLPAAFKASIMPRGVLRCFATDKDDATVDPRFGKVGKQTIEDTGPLTSKRMPTVDDEFEAASYKFMEAAVKEKKPFFAWYNTTRMHIYTHLRPESRHLADKISSDYDLYGSALMELDANVGRMLDKLEQMGIADNTIVIFTTDNGSMSAWWPDGGTTPFRGEKATTWEGGVRVPLLICWPGKIPAGSVCNGIQSHEDLFTTLAAAAGEPDIAQKLKVSNKVYIDGVNNLDAWLGKGPSKRNSHIYYNENQLTAVRVGPWKLHIKTNAGFFTNPDESTRGLLFNLRMDPYEQRDGVRGEFLSMNKPYIGSLLSLAIAEHMQTFQEFPVRQKNTAFDTVKE